MLIVRPGEQEEEQEADPVEVQNAVREWQEWFTDALGSPVEWPDGPTQPYWTDKPDWDGFGAVLLLAAYDERPDLRPSEGAEQDNPRDFAEAPAYQAAAAEPERYLTLLAGVEWWLPLAVDPLVIEAPRPTGDPILMGSIDRLIAELRLLDERVNVFAGHDPAVLRRGLPGDDPTVEEVARFGLAVMLDLAETAREHRQPLLLDY